jgi:hypothetical protein
VRQHFCVFANFTWKSAGGTCCKRTPALSNNLLFKRAVASDQARGRKRMTDAAAVAPPRFSFFASVPFSARRFIVLIKPRAGSTCALKFGKIWRQQKVTTEVCE